MSGSNVLMRYEFSVVGNCRVLSHPHEWTMEDSLNHFMRLNKKEELIIK